MGVHFLVSAILLGALVVLLIATAQPEDGPGVAGISGVQAYDYFVVDLDYRHYDAGREPGYRLRAARFTRHTAPDYDLIRSPEFEIYHGEGQPWTITAENGRSVQDAFLGEQRVDLSDSVVVHGTDSRGRKVEIYTDFLSLYPDSERFSTDYEVDVVREESRVIGNGMTGNLNNRQIKLQGNVRGYYANGPDE